jgi:hypothetical protein
MHTQSRGAVSTPLLEASARETLFARFISASAVLTGFDASLLRGTGVAPSYFELVLRSKAEPQESVSALRAMCDGVLERSGVPRSESDVAAFLREHAAASDLANAVIKLWYLGTWYDPQTAQEYAVSDSPSI